MTQLPAGDNPWETLSSEEEVRRPSLSFFKDRVRINGFEKDYSFIRFASGIGIVALREDGMIPMVGQWRYPIETYAWEIPAGTLEEGESPLETAKRELAEEAGLKAQKWTPLGAYYMEPSVSTQKSYLFLAEELTEVGMNPDDDEVLEVIWLPFEEALGKVASGEIEDAFTVIGLLKAQAHLRSAE